jgi:hypothetical protein
MVTFSKMGHGIELKCPYFALITEDSHGITKLPSLQRRNPKRVWNLLCFLHEVPEITWVNAASDAAIIRSGSSSTAVNGAWITSTCQ